jgi:energy-coupling factor transport system ATP-binding protein
MIEALNLTFTYPGSSTPVLNGVTLTLQPGERAALMGANGSGKTTLVRCLNAILEPTSGTVAVDGLTVSSDPDSLFEIRRRVGLVFQNPDDQMVATSVEREIAFGLENLGLPRLDMIKRIDSVLEGFGLSAERHTPPHRLSGGQRQRLALASVVAMKPSYLILDEPTSLLDPRAQDAFHELLRTALRDAGVLFVTQYPEEALLFDRLIVMDSGRIVLDDAPKSVFEHQDELRRIGLDAPATLELSNFLQELNHSPQRLQDSRD